MKKKIAFVIYYHKSNRYSFNALVGALETNEIFENINIFFMPNKERLIEQLNSIIKNYNTVIIGVSFFTTQLWEIYRLVKILKLKYENKIILIAGGPHPTGDPLGTLDLGFDIVILREGEKTLIELFNNIINKKELTNIKGIAYYNDDKDYIFTGKRDYIDLNKYPPFPIKNSKFGPIEITRGCPFVCYFCQTPYILGSIPRHRSIKSICKYVQYMKEKNLTDIRFITPNAFSYGSKDGKKLNLPKLEELLVKIKNIIEPDGRIFFGTFPSEVRPEHVNENTLRLILKYASNDNIIIGAQSGSQRILDLCNRGHTIEDIYNAVNLTLDSKLKANVDFIFGLPGETKDDIKLTIKMMEELTKKGARIHAHSFIPLPQTPFALESCIRIPKKIKETIKEFTSKGFAFGDWRKQERIAIKISKYLKTKRFN
ncbi:MAG: TIGR04013 family B12-binding domain/radical SAM domain-containing protein [Promethearchaeota archaeon]